jgi:hypothetical protein
MPTGLKVGERWEEQNLAVRNSKNHLKQILVNVLHRNSVLGLGIPRIWNIFGYLL